MLFTKLVFSNGKRFGCIVCTVAKYFLASPIRFAKWWKQRSHPKTNTGSKKKMKRFLLIYVVSVENMKFLVQTHHRVSILKMFPITFHSFTTVGGVAFLFCFRKVSLTVKYRQHRLSLRAKIFWNLFCFMIIRSILFSYACAWKQQEFF